MPLELQEGAEEDAEGGIPADTAERDAGLDMDGKPSFSLKAFWVSTFGGKKEKEEDGAATPGVSFDPALGPAMAFAGGGGGGGARTEAGLEKLLDSMEIRHFKPGTDVVKIGAPLHARPVPAQYVLLVELTGYTPLRRGRRRLLRHPQGQARGRQRRRAGDRYAWQPHAAPLQPVDV